MMCDRSQTEENVFKFASQCLQQRRSRTQGWHRDADRRSLQHTRITMPLNCAHPSFLGGGYLPHSTHPDVHPHSPPRHSKCVAAPCDRPSLPSLATQSSAVLHWHGPRSQLLTDMGCGDRQAVAESCLPLLSTQVTLRVMEPGPHVRVPSPLLQWE